MLLAAWFLNGFCNMTGNVLAMTLMQRLTPNRLLGRVNGATSTVAFGLMPLGAVTGGLVGEGLGLPVVFFGAAALLGLSVLYAMLAIPGSAAADLGPDAGRAPRPVASPRPVAASPPAAASRTAPPRGVRRAGARPDPQIGRDRRPTDQTVQRVWRAGALGGGPGLR